MVITIDNLYHFNKHKFNNQWKWELEAFYSQLLWKKWIWSKGLNSIKKVFLLFWGILGRYWISWSRGQGSLAESLYIMINPTSLWPGICHISEGDQLVSPKDCFLTLSITSICHNTNFSPCLLKIGHASLCLQGNHFTNWVITSALKVSLSFIKVVEFRTWNLVTEDLDQVIREDDITYSLIHVILNKWRLYQT